MHKDEVDCSGMMNIPGYMEIFQRVQKLLV
jgi:hypothetical protein